MSSPVNSMRLANAARTTAETGLQATLRFISLPFSSEGEGKFARDSKISLIRLTSKVCRANGLFLRLRRLPCVSQRGKHAVMGKG